MVNSINVQSLMAGKSLHTTVTALEADGDTVTFACSSAVDPSRWTLDENTGEFSFRSSTADTGLAQFDFTATDKDGTSAAVPLSVMVAAPPSISFEPPVNGALAASATIATEAGRSYALQYTTSLTNNPPVWNEVDVQDGTGDPITLQDSTVGATAGEQRFYRVVIP